MKTQRLFSACLFLCAVSVQAKLPDPTPEQAQAAAEKKAQTDAQAEEDKRKLSETMDQLAQRWRKKAAQEGWATHAPTPEKSASAAPDKAASSAPVKSEKAGTAPPSADVKKPESERPK